MARRSCHPGQARRQLPLHLPQLQRPATLDVGPGQGHYQQAGPGHWLDCCWTERPQQLGSGPYVDSPFLPISDF